MNILDFNRDCLYNVLVHTPSTIVLCVSKELATRAIATGITFNRVFNRVFNYDIFRYQNPIMDNNDVFNNDEVNNNMTPLDVYVGVLANARGYARAEKLTNMKNQYHHYQRTYSAVMFPPCEISDFTVCLTSNSRNNRRQITIRLDGLVYVSTFCGIFEVCSLKSTCSHPDMGPDDAMTMMKYFSDIPCIEFFNGNVWTFADIIRDLMNPHSILHGK